MDYVYGVTECSATAGTVAANRLTVCSAEWSGVPIDTAGPPAVTSGYKGVWIQNSRSEGTLGSRMRRGSGQAR